MPVTYVRKGTIDKRKEDGNGSFNFLPSQVEQEVSS